LVLRGGQVIAIIEEAPGIPPGNITDLARPLYYHVVVPPTPFSTVLFHRDPDTRFWDIAALVEVRDTLTLPRIYFHPIVPGNPFQMSRVIAPPKTSAEVINFAVDFLDRMNPMAGESINSQSVAVTVYSGVDPTPPTFTVSTSGTVVTVVQTGGVAGVTYQVVVQVITSFGQTLQKAFFLTVINALT
jgi:hypothetical protein